MRVKQGPDRDKYQGYTKDKKHTTKLFDVPQEAAVALATLTQNIALGLTDTDIKKSRGKRNSMAARGELPYAPPCATFSSCFVLTCAAPLCVSQLIVALASRPCRLRSLRISCRSCCRAIQTRL